MEKRNLNFLKNDEGKNMGIYKSAKEKYEDIYIDTSFGKTHLIETGNLSGSPLLVFHGRNATTTYFVKTL